MGCVVAATVHTHIATASSSVSSATERRILSTTVTSILSGRSKSEIVALDVVSLTDVI